MYRYVARQDQPYLREISTQLEAEFEGSFSAYKGINYHMSILSKDRIRRGMTQLSGYEVSERVAAFGQALYETFDVQADSAQPGYYEGIDRMTNVLVIILGGYQIQKEIDQAHAALTEAVGRRNTSDNRAHIMLGRSYRFSDHVFREHIIDVATEISDAVLPDDKVIWLGGVSLKHRH